MLSVELFLPSEEGWGKLNDGSIEINLTYSLQVPAGDTVTLNTSYSSLWFSWSLPMLGRTGTWYTLVRPLWLYNVSLLPPPGPRNLDNIIAQSCVISEESYNCQWSILVFCTDFWLIATFSIIIAITDHGNIARKSDIMLIISLAGADDRERLLGREAG